MMNDQNDNYRLCQKTRIYLLKEYLDGPQCAKLSSMIANRCAQGAVESIEIKNCLWNFIKGKFSGRFFYYSIRNRYFEITSIGDLITITNNRSPTPRHRDSRIQSDQIFKLAFYLNDVENGGTVFHDGITGESIKVENKMGNGILFDMDLEHEGENMIGASITKMMIGARPVIKYC